MKISVIFDMDGVIIDSEPRYMEFDVDFFRSLGVIVPKSVSDQFPGTSYREIIKIVEKEVGLPNTYEETLEKYNIYHKLNFKLDFKAILNQEIIPLLIELKNKGCKTAIASSSSNEKIEKMLSECNLGEYFDIYISGTDFKQSKPNPEIYIETARRLNSQINQCLVFEDSIKGITAAKAAGMKVVGVKHKTLISDLSQTDYIIENFKEIDYSAIEKIINT